MILPFKFLEGLQRKIKHPENPGIGGNRRIRREGRPADHTREDYRKRGRSGTKQQKLLSAKARRRALRRQQVARSKAARNND